MARTALAPRTAGSNSNNRPFRKDPCSRTESKHSANGRSLPFCIHRAPPRAPGDGKRFRRTTRTGRALVVRDYNRTSRTQTQMRTSAAVVATPYQHNKRAALPSNCCPAVCVRTCNHRRDDATSSFIIAHFCGTSARVCVCDEPREWGCNVM